MRRWLRTGVVSWHVCCIMAAAMTALVTVFLIGYRAQAPTSLLSVCSGPSTTVGCGRLRCLWLSQLKIEKSQTKGGCRRRSRGFCCVGW